MPFIPFAIKVLSLIRGINGHNGLIAGTDPVAVETVCLKILTEKRHALRGEPWPISPPPICVEAADKVYGLGTSKMEEIKIAHFGWEEDLLLG